MKIPTSTILTCTFFALAASLSAENHTEATPLTMEQLMRELRLQGGNFQFTFDQAVFARITTEVGDRTQPATLETERFDTASAQPHLTLFFSASAASVGDYRKL